MVLPAVKPSCSFIIGTVSSYLGYTATGGSRVGRCLHNESCFVDAPDFINVLLVRMIFLAFPTAHCDRAESPIRFEGVSKSFGGKHVLDDVSFVVRRSGLLHSWPQRYWEKRHAKLLMGLLKPDCGKSF
jgi:hypothetical protein